MHINESLFLSVSCQLKIQLKLREKVVRDILSISLYTPVNKFLFMCAFSGATCQFHFQDRCSTHNNAGLFHYCRYIDELLVRMEVSCQQCKNSLLGRSINAVQDQKLLTAAHQAV